MPWQDRLFQAAYNSPSGVRLVFGYEDVSLSIDKNTAGFNFPDADGTYVQTSGRSSRRIPLRIFFWGNEYDTEADAFLDALVEDGIGRLEHPKYGSINVIPFGTITRRDDLKTAANQAIFELNFWETIGLVYPTSQSDPGTTVLQAVKEYDKAATEEFEEQTDLDSAVEQSSFKGFFQTVLDVTDKELKKIADTQEDVSKQFNAIKDSINNGIDILVGDPLTLAFQTVQLIQAPARALTSIEARLDAYGNLAATIVSQSGVAVPGLDSNNLNEFLTNDLYASSYVTGSIISVVNNQFTTKPEAIAAAELIFAQLEIITNWREDNFNSLSEIDTGAAYQQLQEAVAITAGFLVEISFTLKQERRIVLNRNRSLIDLVAELYGTVDADLDFFIDSNDLSGSEILEIPRGREIVYYV